MNVNELAGDIVESVKEYVGRMLAPILERLAQIEARPPGKDGEPGLPGKNGEPGKSITIDDVRPMVDEFLRSIPVPKDGAPGKDGEPGVDGKSPTLDEIRQMWLDVYAQKQGEWALDFERRAQDILQRAIERVRVPQDGAPGKDGRDGLGVEDFDATIDGRTITLTIRRGEFVKSRTLKIPAVLDAGVFRDGANYEKGDGVTFGGSFWIAQNDNPKGKPGLSSDWRLAVKKGRDGSDRGGQ